MPWKATCAMDQRLQFIADWLSGAYAKSCLCEVYGISRPTGDKWIARYQTSGLDGLKEHSRAPVTHPNAVSEALRALIMDAKLTHQDWGPKKVMDWLRRHRPDCLWPADSTAGTILKRAGLVRPRRRRRRVTPDTLPFGTCVHSNDTWSADFKGHFRLGNGQRCYPLTISDNHSRYVLLCRGLSRPTHQGVQPWFEWVFREYGMPTAIRTDNGVPFASLALGGISHLSKWWIRLGIRPERIRPGRPDQNGRHERMHRTLKAAAIKPPEQTLLAQQRRFDHFVHEFNCERAHEALQRVPPAQIYRPSERPYPTKLPSVEYDTGTIVRRVRHNGEIKWRGHYIYLTEVLASEPVALEPVGDHLWQIRYGILDLGVLNEMTNRVKPTQGWHGHEQKRKPCPRSKT